MAEQDKYAQVLADLEQRRDDINRAIATIRAMAEMPPESGESSGGPGPAMNGTGSLRPHMFFGMKAPDAVRAYLSAVKQTRTAARIAEDLIEYGWNTTSDSPSNVIRTALVRLAESGEAVQVKDKEWGLVSWFPGLNRGKRSSAPEDREVEPAKEKKPRSNYHAFLSEKMSQGMTMKQAAEAWAKQKAAG